MTVLRTFLLTIIAGLLFISCKKDSFITSPNALLHTSVDTLMFDTVFVSAGSVTKSFKIFNDNNQKLKISKIKLAPAGNATPFKMNIDGIPANEVDDVEIAANDSIYVFVQVNIDPSLATNPFLISDSILINYNGNNRYVQLQAYGQNAHFIRCPLSEIATNTTWANDLPYVLLCPLQIDPGITLTIQKGCRIYAHADAPILVYGTLTVKGTLAEKVTFRGDRLDPDYRDLPAGWPGIIFFRSSTGSSFKFSEILNAFDALFVDSSSVTLTQTRIDNAYEFGIYSNFSTVHADNSLISNCGKDLYLVNGGDYQFVQCTVVGYSNSNVEHKSPVLQLSDKPGGNPLTATFTNCIFWGNNDVLVPDEVVVDTLNPFSGSFNNVLYKGAVPPNATASITGDPMFDTIDVSRNIYDFHINLHPNPAIINAGIAVPGFLNDLDDFTRIDTPDLGCYEKK
jgi:hypothetical protein